MLRTTTISAAALLGLTLLAPPTAHAVGETCRGEAATLVGSPQTIRITGTEGRDVIVTNGSSMVDALGGDDLVCVTGFGAQVFAGDGDDLVDATTLGELGVQARLGSGNDRFEGGPGADVVWGGTEGTSSVPLVDIERDVIGTGPPASSGIPRDTVYSGQRGASNEDEIRIQRGVLIWAGIPTATTVVVGGADSILGLDGAAGGSITLDNVAGTMAVDAQPLLRFSGFTGFSLLAMDGLDDFSFRGGSRDEQLSLDLWEATPQTVKMGGGDDDVRFYAPYAGGITKQTSYAGGAGRDTLELTLPEELDVDLDLARGRLSTGRTAREVTVRATGFESSSVMAEDVELSGTSGSNTLRVYACRSTVEGRAGKDRLATFDEVMDEGLQCRGAKARFFGGSGKDALVGGRGPDRLVGGPGRDSVDGSTGRDVCQGEKLRRCEVRLRG